MRGRLITVLHPLLTIGWCDRFQRAFQLHSPGVLAAAGPDQYFLDKNGVDFVSCSRVSFFIVLWKETIHLLPFEMNCTFICRNSASL